MEPKYLSVPFVLVFTVYDVLIVEGVFAKAQIWDIIHVYHQATYSILIPILIVLTAIGLKSWRFLTYSGIGIYCGWLDLLYFWMQLKPLPAVYAWLNFPFPSPSWQQLLAFASLSLTTAVVLDFTAWKTKR